MKRTFLILIAILVAASASAGMTYQFQSVVDTGKGGMSGKTSVEGKNVRLDITKGDGVMFKDGSVMISTNGGQTFSVLDPKAKSYYEIDFKQLVGTLGAVMNSMGGMVKISFDNHKVKVTSEGAGEKIESYATTKYLTESSYDMIMTVFGRKSTTNVVTRTETWVTDKISPDFMTFVQEKGLRTGIDELDKFIEKETSTIKGFPLKQVVQSSQTQGSKVQKSTTTATVSSIQETKLSDSSFAIPDGFKQVESPMAGLEALGKKQ